MSIVTSLSSELLDRNQAAAFLGLRPQTLAVWATTKRYALPFIRVGSRVRYRRADLERFLDQRTVGADPQDAAGNFAE